MDYEEFCWLLIVLILELLNNQLDLVFPRCNIGWDLYRKLAIIRY